MIQWRANGKGNPVSDLGYQSPVLGKRKRPKSGISSIDLDAYVTIPGFEDLQPGVEATFVKFDRGWRCTDLFYSRPGW